MITQSHLRYLTLAEQQTLSKFSRALPEKFGDLVQAVILFGSKARGDGTAESDLDVLVVVDTDDWRIHKQICYLAVDIGLEHNVFNISPRIWSTTHLRQMAQIEAVLYRQIQQVGVNLLQPTTSDVG
jgi:predicted nucleotidyltransferase